MPMPCMYVYRKCAIIHGEVTIIAVTEIMDILLFILKQSNNRYTTQQIQKQYAITTNIGITTFPDNLLR